MKTRIIKNCDILGLPKKLSFLRNGVWQWRLTVAVTQTQYYNWRCYTNAVCVTAPVSLHCRVMEAYWRCYSAKQVAAWHRAFEGIVVSHHPTLWKFLNAIWREKATQHTVVNQMVANYRTPYRKCITIYVRKSQIDTVSDNNNREFIK